jgi:exopolyphosphatase / guanosine-5'-triphosphate,3'-diphosphate pyrophosphatase
VARAAAGGGLTPIVERATITRIGRGVDATGLLAAEGIDATLAALRDFVGEAKAAGATAIAAVGTSALRDARNGGAFLEPAATILGGDVEVISGEREAHLTFRGATFGLPLEGQEVTVVDIGGGSTEIVRGRGRHIQDAVSLPVGSVRLFERHVRHDPPLVQEIDRIVGEVEDAIGQHAPFLGEPLVGIAGTVTTLAAMVEEIDSYDPSRIHGALLTCNTIDDLLGRMLRMPLSERQRLPGLDPRRADVIVAGAAIAGAVLARSHAPHMHVSHGGVRFGRALELHQDSASRGSGAPPESG